MRQSAQGSWLHFCKHSCWIFSDLTAEVSLQIVVKIPRHRIANSILIFKQEITLPYLNSFLHAGCTLSNYSATHVRSKFRDQEGLVSLISLPILFCAFKSDSPCGIFLKLLFFVIMNSLEGEDETSVAWQQTIRSEGRVSMLALLVPTTRPEVLLHGLSFSLWHLCTFAPSGI